jgi:hypothetical protein
VAINQSNTPALWVLEIDAAHSTTSRKLDNGNFISVFLDKLARPGGCLEGEGLNVPGVLLNVRKLVIVVLSGEQTPVDPTLEGRS